ncbi:MAG: alpha/beta hydrolase [Nisaea sp.]|uniref:alpha/beta hydrolase n=1 Tax=Nisaea sp. TaxID=2024842 RepID=UPI001B0555E6|nr:alpha/beta hydrolase [Nisaea sp.]MBO6559500.1 alpha/beta hydrolase [Nisaea sp.]
MTEQTQQPEMPSPLYAEKPDGARLAYHKLDGLGPTIVFLGGFMSDMTGTKAMALEDLAQARGQAFLRLDYQGHGQSSGKFEDGCIGTWLSDALYLIDEVTEGPLVLVGSSMGGWIMLQTALQRPARIAGLVGIAPAPDFTEDLMWAGFSDEIKRTLERDGVYYEPSEYSDEPYTITMKLIEDGRNHLVMREKMPITAPVRLLHGMRDESVPYDLSLKISDNVASEDVQIRFIKDGDHRLSTERDIAILKGTVAALCDSAA